jgi:hypothetical protein
MGWQLVEMYSKSFKRIWNQVHQRTNQHQTIQALYLGQYIILECLFASIQVELTHFSAARTHLDTEPFQTL